MEIRSLSRSELVGFEKHCRAEGHVLTAECLPVSLGKVFVAEDRGRWTGWMLTVPDYLKPSQGTLSNIWVEPASRHQGVASALMQAGLEWARDLGLFRLELWVREDNMVARRLYRQHGFRESGWMRSAADPADRICLQMVLPLQEPAAVAA